MDPAVVTSLAIAVLAPGVVALIAFSLAWWARRGRPEAAASESNVQGTPASTGRAAIAPLIFGLIVAAAFPILFEVRSFPPARAFDWMPFVALAAAALGVLAPGGLGGGLPLKPAARWLARAVLVTAAAFVSSRTLLKGWGPATAALWIGGFVTLTLGAFAASERTQAKSHGWSGPAVLALWAGAASQVLIATLDSLRQGQVALAISAVAGAAALVGLVRPRLTLAPAGSHVPIAVTSAALFQAAILHDGLPGAWWVELLLLVASISLPSLPPPGPRAALWRIVLACIPAIAAVALALATMSPTS